MCANWLADDRMARPQLIPQQPRQAARWTIAGVWKTLALSLRTRRSACQGGSTFR